MHTALQPMVYTPISAVANLRRSLIIGSVLGLVAVVVGITAGHPMLGVFGLVGIGLGALNNWLLQKAVVRSANGGITKKRFTGGVFGRLGGVTLIAICLALLVRPDGVGIFVGLAVFQVLMLVGAALPVFRSLRPNAGRSA